MHHIFPSALSLVHDTTGALACWAAISPDAVVGSIARASEPAARARTRELRERSRVATSEPHEDSVAAILATCRAILIEPRNDRAVSRWRDRRVAPHSLGFRGLLA